NPRAGRAHAQKKAVLEKTALLQRPSESFKRASREPAVGIEPTTARLRIECSTTELRWRADRCCVLRVSRVVCPGADSNRDALRHHPLKMACLPISPPGPNKTAGATVLR